MLRLEKSQNRDIQIAMRSKQSWMRKDVMQAFGIAFMLHLIAFGAVRIHSILQEEDQSHLRTQVFVEPIQHNPLISEAKIQTSLPEPIALVPTIPSIPLQKVEIPFTFVEESQLGSNPFQVLEEDWDQFAHVGSRSQRAPIQVNVYGNLTEKTLLNDGIKTVMTSHQSGAIRYEVRMNNQSGIIFWHELKQASESSEMVQNAEMILRNIRFAKDNGDLTTTGEVEIVYD